MVMMDKLHCHKQKVQFILKYRQNWYKVQMYETWLTYVLIDTIVKRPPSYQGEEKPDL